MDAVTECALKVQLKRLLNEYENAGYSEILCLAENDLSETIDLFEKKGLDTNSLVYLVYAALEVPPKKMSRNEKRLLTDLFGKEIFEVLSDQKDDLQWGSENLIRELRRIPINEKLPVVKLLSCLFTVDHCLNEYEFDFVFSFFK